VSQVTPVHDPTLVLSAPLPSYGFDAAMAGDAAYEASPLPGDFHTHRDERGLAVRCYHTCRSAVLSWQLWLGFTLSFPFEHALWEKVPPFNLIAQRLGLL